MKQHIEVRTVYDGERSMEQAFLSLLMDRYREIRRKEIIDIASPLHYNEAGLNHGGLCG